MQGIDQQVAAAYHVAGRAVACALRGWTQGWVTLDEAQMWPHARAEALPFVDYAGVWASARRRGDLAGEPGVSEDRFAAAMSAHPDDACAVGVAQLEVATALTAAGQSDVWGWLPGVTAAWRAELEQMWPVVQHVAVLLLAGRVVSAQRVRRLADDRLLSGLAV